MILVDDVASAKLHVCAHLVPVIQETARVLGLEVEIVRVGVRPESNLLQRDRMRLLTRFLLLLLQLVPILAVVDDLANRRLGAGGDLYQVQPPVFGKLQCVLNRIYPVLSLRINDADSVRIDLMIDSNSFDSCHSNSVIVKRARVTSQVSAI